MYAKPYFSLPLHPSKQPHSLRASKHRTKRKRDRSPEEDGEQENSQPTSSQQTPQPAHQSSQFTPINVSRPTRPDPLSPSTSAQYTLAGLDPSEPLPPAPFPHRALPAEPSEEQQSRRAISSTVQHELSTLKPPIYVPNATYVQDPSVRAPRDPQGPRQRHFGVLTALMHKCLLEGDYIRAGRAWGMLLRSKYGGRSINFCSEGRWGIGAEILLRRDQQLQQRRREMAAKHRRERDHGQDLGIGDEGEEETAAATSRAEEDDLNLGEGEWMTLSSFQLAKEYYERLILQYPYRHHRPSSTNPLDFYPALFGLWIYATEAAYKSAITRSRTAGGLPADYSNNSSMLDDTLEPRSSPPQPQEPSEGAYARHANVVEEARQQAFDEAVKIAARMDEAMASPPYSDNAELLNMRGMLHLWVGDLMVPETDAFRDDWEVEEEDVEERLRRWQRRGEAAKALEERRSEVERAKMKFRKVEAMGGELWEGARELLYSEGELREEDEDNDEERDAE